MPTKPKTPCCYRGYPRCGKLTDNRYCDEHAKAVEQARQRQVDARRKDDPNRSKYNLEAWKRIRRMVLNAEPMCRKCKQNGIIRGASHVDHIKPVNDGGDDSFENLQPLCHSCHSAKTCSVDGGFGNVKRK